MYVYVICTYVCTYVHAIFYTRRNYKASRAFSSKASLVTSVFDPALISLILYKYIRIYVRTYVPAHYSHYLCIHMYVCTYVHLYVLCVCVC